MFDLGTSFLASVARDPNALAIVDGTRAADYQEWYRRISSVVAGLDALGLKPGDHLVTVLQNRWEAATIHWACQFAGIIVTPVNWRATADDLDFFCADAGAKALIYEDVSAEAARGCRAGCPGMNVGDFVEWFKLKAPDAAPRAEPDAWSVMLYTSGTTAQPKGVPRRQRAERAAALAHVAQNMYRSAKRTLGVMPLITPWACARCIAMSLIGGTFVCLPRFDAARALELIEAEKITNLYLVPTLYHDLLHHRAFAQTDVSSVRKLGFAGASMTDGC
jgi:2-furoate---CoA ligase